MTRHDVRYVFEHRILPELFFSEPARFFGLLMKNRGILFEIMEEIFQKNEMENPYSKDDFSIEARRLSSGGIVLKLGFPYPEEEPLCFHSYLFLDNNCENPGYFCIERGNGFEGEVHPYVCSWTKEGNHRNYGTCSFDEHGDFESCFNAYKGLLKIDASLIRKKSSPAG